MAYLILPIVAVLMVAFVLWAHRRVSPAVNPRLAARRRIEKLQVTQYVSLGVLGAMLITPYLPGQWTKLWITLAMLAAFAVDAFVLRPLWRYRFRNRLRVCDHYICPRCFYLLVGLPDPGRCPECGYEFTHAGLVEEWNHVYKAHILSKSHVA